MGELARRARIDVDAAWSAWTHAPTATVRARLADLRALGRWLSSGAELELEPREIGRRLAGVIPGQARELVLRWTTAQVSSGLAGTTIARRISTLASWWLELGQHGSPYVYRLPRPRVVAYQRGRCPPRGAVEEAIAMLAAGQRWRELAALLLLSDVGLRRSEAVGLRCEDLQGGPPPAVSVVRKGGARVTLTISDRCARAIDRAIGGRRKGPVITNARGRALSGSGLWRWIRAWGLSHPHALRSSGATEIYDRTHDAELVRAWLGHAHLSTTAIYVRHLRDTAGDATRMLAGEAPKQERPPTR